jgi:hypothetical protein
MDVYFDEEFKSTLAYQPHKFFGCMNIRINHPIPATDLPPFHTGNPYVCAQHHSPGFVKFAQADVEEINDETVKQDQAHHLTIEEVLRYRIIDGNPETLTKYLDDDLPTWMPMDTLLQQNPRAVQLHTPV